MNAAQPLNINLNHGINQVDQVIGYPTKALFFIKKNSINNVIPVSAAEAWVQFSCAYIIGTLITSNDLSFITSILNPSFTSTYAFISIIFSVIFVKSLIIQSVNKKTIKQDQIDKKIRGGKENEESDIYKKASKIEIISDCGNKSIVFPISKSQAKELEAIKDENRDKIILLILPPIFASVFIFGALFHNKFSFSNIYAGEALLILPLLAIIISGFIITVVTFRKNEIDHENNSIKGFNVRDILLPSFLKKWKCTRWESKTIKVMENRLGDQEEGDLISRLEKLLDKHFAKFSSDIVKSFGGHLSNLEDLVKNELLNPANKNIKETLDRIGGDVDKTLNHLEGIREDLKEDINELKNDILHMTKAVNKIIGKNEGHINTTITNINQAAELLKDKIERFVPSRWIGYLKDFNQVQQEQNTGSNDHEATEFIGMIESMRNEMENMSKKYEELKQMIDRRGNVHYHLGGNDNIYYGNNSDSNSENSTDPLSENETLHLGNKKLRQEHERLMLKKENSDLTEENKKLMADFTKQDEKEKSEKAINDKASNFFGYILKELKGELSKSFNDKVKIKIHWKDSSQTTCHINNPYYKSKHSTSSILNGSTPISLGDTRSL
ncbi:hypothetical protein [Wolbachia endosymbiont of Pentidionis agamae]|uniref:hypothetical protein n=1 Tax=Wolbachia endosymbiont of Pentidionis agamae TaxID=3110435 RepID=UPI002FD58634